MDKNRQLILVIWTFCTVFLELIEYDRNVDVITSFLSIIITAMIYYIIGVIIMYFIDGIYKNIFK